ncbi:MAG: hypothetical protein MK297_04135 [Planctomycetes bacterium]|nr:hypothetical protein [Planctomycetota bacterium]
MTKGPKQLLPRLREVREDLFDAVRQVSRPAWIWIVGVFYPEVTVNLELDKLLRQAIELGEAIQGQGKAEASTQFTEFATVAAQDPGVSFTLLGLGGSLLLVLIFGTPLLLATSRLFAGLASCARRDAWAQTPSPSLAHIWARGEGMSMSSFGLSVLLGLMKATAILLLVGAPVLFFQGVLTGGGLEEHGALLAVIYLPIAGVLILYSLVMGALHQLALHSLVENRRGMTSALRHAWRLLRVNSTLSVAYVLMELACVLVLTLSVAAVGLTTSFICLLAPATIFLSLMLYGFTGVLRAAFWSRAYRRLGGATSGDRLGGVGLSPGQS